MNLINDKALPHTWHAGFARTAKRFEINFGVALGARIDLLLAACLLQVMSYRGTTPCRIRFSLRFVDSLLVT